MSISFSAPVTYAAGTGPTDVTTADLNGDGKNDIIVADEGDFGTGTEGGIDILYNDGSGNFLPAVSLAAGDNPVGVLAADLTGNGNSDLVVEDYGFTDGTGGVDVLMSDGSGGFLPPVSYATVPHPEGMAIADLNGDDKPDIVVGSASGDITVLLNNGSGGFLPGVTYAVGSSPFGIAIADLTGDGSPDLIIADGGNGSAGSGGIDILTNDGSGGFALTTSYAVGLFPGGVITADLTGNGQQDIIVGDNGDGSPNSTGFEVLMNNGSGGFLAPVPYGVSNTTTDTGTTADITSTAVPDLIGVDWTNTLYIFQNDGSGAFLAPVTYPAGVAPTAVTTADLNGDGKPDIVVSDFGDGSAGSGGVEVLTNLDSPLCFVAGTRIATPSGEVLVEQLVAGDTVLTLKGQARRIVWIGQGQVLATRGRRNAATPVIVRKGALADNVPNHDLRITKAHSLYINEVLIPVEFLVNHRSITWDDHAQEVSLYHIELESHDVLIANGAPAESYRDDGNRWLFRNANSGWDLPPKEPCAPVVTGGPVVDGAWRRLLDRTGPRPGVPLTDDPDLHLLVDGKRVDAVSHRDSRYLFCLATAPRAMRIVSRQASPQELGLARDPRCLGVALHQVLVSQGIKLRTLEAGDTRLAKGFHGYEANNAIRWTDGDASVPEDLFDGFAGPLEVTLRLAGKTTYVAGGMRRLTA